MTPGLELHLHGRLEALATALAAALDDDPLPPLAAETILVPSRGLASWLELQLAERHGIAGGIVFPFPGAFLAGLLGQPAALPFAPEVLALRIARLLADPDRQRELGLAARYCDDDRDGYKRYQLAARLARVFDDYQLYRDDLLLRAAAGDDLAEHGAHGPWQAALWRALLRDAGAPVAAPAKHRGSRRREATPLLFPDLAPAPPPAPAATNAAHRLEALRALLADPARARAALPPRISVFGASSLPPAFLDLLRRMAAHVPVHLYVPQATPHFTGDLRARGPSPGNPLLARFGVLGREFADALLALEDQTTVPCRRHEPEPPLPDDEAPTLLACLQGDLAAVFDRGEPGARRFPLRRDDDSLRVHDCHSPQRELEVVRDHVLAAFAADRALEPHDVLVLVPDIASYAPFAEAVFGPFRHVLPYRVADRDPRSELPPIAAVLAVLALARDRVQVFDVLRLCELPALRRRFRLEAGDVPVLRHLCQRAGIRWGIDADSRARQFRLPPFDDNSWQFGLERLLLGVATGPCDDLVLGRLPVADATSSRDELLARFLCFVRTLFDQLPLLQKAQPPQAWADRLDALAAALFAPASADDEQALQRLQQATAALRTEAAAARLTEPWSPVVLRAWLETHLRRAGGGGGFLTGAVTIAALQPMRMVPVRHLFVCGLGDQAFPRRDRPAAFDLMAANRRPGDRSARLDDQQLFLEALLAARGRLHLTFVGRSQKDDSPCAPSTALAELLDHLDRSCAVVDAGSTRARDAVLVRHPLQPWSRRYRDGSDARLFTYARDAAPAVPSEPVPEVPFAAAAVAVPPELLRPEQSFARLCDFWRHPCRFYLEQVLRLRLPRDDDQEHETEPFRVQPLDRWRLQDPAVRAACRGEPPPADPLAAARATGALPVGGLGTLAFADVDEETQAFLRRIRPHVRDGRRDLRVAVGDVSVHGEVLGCGDDELVLARIAKLKPKDRMRAWLHHLLLAAARGQSADGLPARTLVFAKDATVRLAPLPPAVAATLLAHLLKLRAEGLAVPLPFFEKSSFAYADAIHRGKPAADAARAALGRWQPDSSEFGSPNDSEDPAIDLCMRGRDPLAMGVFADLAVAVWSPYLQCAREEKA